MDDLTTHQTQLLIVVQHSVHVLNPNGIHGPVKDEPLAVWCGGVGKCLVTHGENSVRPFMRHWIKFAVQLPHSDGLRIEDNDLNLVLFH